MPPSRWLCCASCALSPWHPKTVAPVSPQPPATPAGAGQSPPGGAGGDGLGTGIAAPWGLGVPLLASPMRGSTQRPILCRDPCPGQSRVSIGDPNNATGGSTCRQRGSTRRPIPARIHSLADPARGPLHPSQSPGPIGVPRGGREPWDPPAPVAGAGRSDPAPSRGPHARAGGTLGTGIPAPTGGSTHGWQHPRVVARPGERPRDGRWGRSQAGAGLAGRPVPKRCLFRCWSTARPYPWPAPCRARHPQEEAEQGRPRSGARRGARAVLPTPKSPFASQECPRARLLLLLPVRPLQPLGRLLEALRSQELPLFGLNPAILVQSKPAGVGGPATFPRVPFPAQPDK